MPAVTKSLYAHLSKYAPGMAEGVRVKKGQLIGYVGTSGMVTGPHLHYELKKDGQQINPLIADLRTGEKPERGCAGRFQACNLSDAPPDRNAEPTPACAEFSRNRFGLNDLLEFEASVV